MEALLHEFKADINHYLKTVKQATKINCLTDIIRFNQINPSIYMPYGQDILELADQKSGLLVKKHICLLVVNNFKLLMLSFN